jgi:hypothetical protein
MARFTSTQEMRSRARAAGAPKTRAVLVHRERGGRGLMATGVVGGRWREEKGPGGL